MTSHINHVLIAFFPSEKERKLDTFQQSTLRESAMLRHTPSPGLKSSRVFVVPGQEAVQGIHQKLSGLQVDLLATGRNHHLPRYVAPNLDPLAFATDAMPRDRNR